MGFSIENSGDVRLLIDQRESEAVKIAARNLRTDLQKVLNVRFVGEDVSSDVLPGKEIPEPAATSRDETGKEFSNVPEILIGTLGVPEMLSLYVSGNDFVDENGALRKEAYLLQVREDRLIIAGSDRRGTIYGIYEISELLGVSPWYFWADVPVRARASFSLQDGYRKFDYPGIEYRGIFINDEEELDHWVRLHMGEDTIGVKTYEKIFELLLRLKGNYIWPAMHVNSFNVKKENGALADRMGVVVGTSHCDMLMRSNNREWKPWLEKKGYPDAKYDYSIEGRNREILKEYWRESVEQNQDFEVSYTLGMRGIHDSGFETENLRGGTPEELRQQKIQLLEMIIRDQEEIISDVLGKASESRQAIEKTSGVIPEISGANCADVFAEENEKTVSCSYEISEVSRGRDCNNEKDILKLFIPYKEVLELYDNGLQLPEDLTLVWSNDNYGYVRRYPSEEARKRKGGNGIYYHNSYWAPPGRSYLFISSYPLAQTKYELEKAYDNGIRRLWVTNMGAIKPLEQEMEFVLRLGWETGKKYDPESTGIPIERLSAADDPQSISRRTADVDDYLANWIDRNFTGNHGREAAALLNNFAQVTNTRKIEVMEEDVFPQTGLKNEAAVRLNKLRALYQKGNEIYESLPMEERPAFFQMVLMKIHAAYYTGAMYYFADRSALCVKRGGK
ncbi:MAG: glycosyl hydrolase 115 family protein [Lachnospiraceae bacterium]|nr:glycosyl hydrolase 115 family protein [Lachnospiraceae bacterium]